jgi:hypothetical protein
MTEAYLDRLVSTAAGLLHGPTFHHYSNVYVHYQRGRGGRNRLQAPELCSQKIVAFSMMKSL